MNGRHRLGALDARSADPLAVDCPVCGASLEGALDACGTCGYPVALHPEARLALLDEEAPEPAKPTPPPGASPARRPPAAAPRARDQTAEACSRSARELEAHLALLRQIGGNTQPYTGGLRQAALVQSEGRLAESLDLLRASEAEAHRALDDLIAQRTQELESRGADLEKDGVFADTATALERLQAAVARAREEEAAGLIVEIDRQIGLVERDWRGLHSLLEQIVELQASARDAGRPIPEVEDDLRGVRELLARPRIDAARIDSASQVSARALMLLHEALPEILEKDLERHGTALSAYPIDHTGSRKAKALHSEVSRHLRRSRLPEAAKGLAQLRREIERLEQEAASAAAAPEPEATPTTEPARPVVDADAALPRLLEKARTLAARVRALEPESDTAYEAAGEIRRATELLRARKLEEADAALTHLMRTLDSVTSEGR